MHHRRLKKRVPWICLIILGLFWSGCRTPQHTNVLIFATNTRTGIDLSYDTKTMEPGLLVGHKRQEGVWMPLMANTEKTCFGGSTPGDPHTHSEDENCNGDSPAHRHHPLYQSEEGTDNRDTYSVLASFGAKFSAKYEDSAGPAASGGLAQYFATGLAARKLAEVGGAALVAVGPAATESAKGARAGFGTADDLISAAELRDLAEAEMRILAKNSEKLDSFRQWVKREFPNSDDAAFEPGYPTNWLSEQVLLNATPEELRKVLDELKKRNASDQ